MRFFLDPGNLILSVVGLGLIVLKAWALIDCARRPAAAFALHNKLSKQIWLALLGVTLLLGLLFANPLGIFSIAGTIAAVVYLVDVKPAVSGSASPWG